MDILKKIFPLSFKYSDTSSNLVIGILIYIVAGVIAGALIALSAFLTIWVPFVGILMATLFGLIVSVVEIYVVAGIVIEALLFAKVLQ